MLIAHFPAGYLASQLFNSRQSKAAVMIGSVLPDIDLVYFYTLGGRAVVHHHYWLHKPFFWIAVLIPVLLLGRLLRWKGEIPCLALSAGIFIHLCLDSITGSIFWLWPFHDAALTLVQVQALHTPWQMNFILHWTFLAEILIILAAAIVFVRNRQNGIGNAAGSSSLM